MDIEKIARAIEQDAGMELAEVRQALSEAHAGLGRVTTPAQMLVRAARAKTGLSQLAFAERIATPVATLRDWEQGRFSPPGGVLCLLRLLERHPDLSDELVLA
jgi:putative transcriptional regulator